MLKFGVEEHFRSLNLIFQDNEMYSFGGDPIYDNYLRNRVKFTLKSIDIN